MSLEVGARFRPALTKFEQHFPPLIVDLGSLQGW